ncbi:MAG: radical SAM protein [Methanobacteriaceae archaeon]
MKVLLINPPYFNSKYKFIGLVAPPLGLAYIAAVLEDGGVNVKIIDAAALQMEWDVLEGEIKKYSPDVVAIGALTPTIEKALKTAKIAKNTVPNAKIVLGGYHPTFTYEEILKNEFIDIVILGEGEYTMLELVQSLKKGRNLREVKGIACRDFKTPPREIIEDVDSLPFPARHLLPMDMYKVLNIKLPTGTLISGRGCPFNCSFCASSAMHGRKMRFRSAENIVDEIEHLINDYDAEMIAFMDDTFTLRPDRVIEICDEIESRNLDFFWGCTARVDSVSKPVLDKMREAGCITIFYGVESADQQLLNEMKKKITIEKTKTAFKLTKEADMRTIASVAIGMPGDTKENIEKTINFVIELDASYALFSLATPYPGTAFYNEAREKNLIKVDDWSKFTLLSPVLETVDCSLEELKKLQKKGFRKFYLRPSYIIRQLRMDGFILLKTIATMLKEV